MSTVKELVLSSLLLARCEAGCDGTSGIVNFNVNDAPVRESGPQPVSLLGCNTVVSARVHWHRDNQTLANIPYGPRISESGKEYYVAQYYLASPPVPHTPAPDETTNLGLLTPDRFAFSGRRPAQIVNLDYSVLWPTYLRHVEIRFDRPMQGNKSCWSQGVERVPINIQCPDFPWYNGALGAAGIGLISGEAGHGSIFVPTLRRNGGSPLQCRATILDEIMLDHEVFFVVDGRKPDKSINLTNLIDKNISLACRPRSMEDVPSGCLPPTNHGPMHWLKRVSQEAFAALSPSALTHKF